MDPAIEAVLREYDQRSEAEMKRVRETPPAEMMKHLDELLLAVGPATGQLMNVLIKEAKAKTIVEVGTSYGYSTVWLAEAARATGGKVITLDVHAEKQEYARSALTRAGLATVVELRLGDARQSIAALEGAHRLRADRPLEGSVHPVLRSPPSEAGSGRDRRRRQHAVPRVFARRRRGVSPARPRQERHAVGVVGGGQRHRAQPLHARPRAVQAVTLTLPRYRSQASQCTWPIAPPHKSQLPAKQMSSLKGYPHRRPSRAHGTPVETSCGGQPAGLQKLDGVVTPACHGVAVTPFAFGHVLRAECVTPPWSPSC